MHKINKSFSVLFIISSVLLCFSCRSIRQPDSVPEALNYSDEDIVQNEIERINKFLETEPVRALWRASLLGRQEVIVKCIENI